MPTPIPHLLNPSIGIADMLPMPDATGLPQARELAAGMLRESTLEGLYVTANARTAAEALLCPDIGDGHAVAPEAFRMQLDSLVAKLRESRNPKIQALLAEEIEPLLMNGMLMTAYRNLMVGG